MAVRPCRGCLCKRQSRCTSDESGCRSTPQPPARFDALRYPLGTRGVDGAPHTGSRRRAVTVACSAGSPLPNRTNRQLPDTSTLRRDLLLAGADEVCEDVSRHRTVGRETDRSLGQVESVQSRPDGFDRRGAEREDPLQTTPRSSLIVSAAFASGSRRCLVMLTVVGGASLLGRCCLSRVRTEQRLSTEPRGIPHPMRAPPGG